MKARRELESLRRSYLTIKQTPGIPDKDSLLNEIDAKLKQIGIDIEKEINERDYEIKQRELEEAKGLEPILLAFAGKAANKRCEINDAEYQELLVHTVTRIKDKLDWNDLYNRRHEHNRMNIEAQRSWIMYSKRIVDMLKKETLDAMKWQEARVKGEKLVFADLSTEGQNLSLTVVRSLHVIKELEALILDIDRATENNETVTDKTQDCERLLGLAEELVATLPEILNSNKVEANALKKSSKKATDSRYAPGRDLYNEALQIAKREWLRGSTLKHHMMKQYLIKEYRSESGIKSPFAKFDSECGYTEKGLLERLKSLAREINRPDLISGQKK